MRNFQSRPLPQASRRPKKQALSKTFQSGEVGCLGIFGLLLLTVVLTVAATVWAIQSQIFSRKFKPVELNDTEQITLEQKLNALGSSTTSSAALTTGSADQLTNELSTDSHENEPLVPDKNTNESTDELQPELYVEDDGKRRIELTERELNALLAKNTDLAEQLVVDLTDNLASIKLLVDLDPDFPFFGGKTLKVSGGTELSYLNDRPVIVMKGVSVWGVPIPNAWLGGLKNIDLVSEFGDEGFWKSVADGIEYIRVEDSKLLIQLAE